MRPQKHILIMLVGAATLAGACGDDDPIIEPVTPTLGVTASKISELKPGEEVAISITVNDFVLDATKMGQPNEAGVGHYHVYWDDASGTGFLTAAADDQVTVKVPANAKEGKHAFNITLMNNDHSPLAPAVAFKLDVTVKAAAPAEPMVTASADTTSDLQPGSPVVLTINTTNFTLDAAKMGQPAEKGVGHYHVYWGTSSGLDFITAAAGGVITVNVPADTAAGKHTLRVELYNNDHTPLSPPVEARIELTVKAGPRLKATSDAGGDLMPGAAVNLTISPTNFTLDASKMSQPAEKGVGHYHVYWDDKSGTDFLTASADSTVSIKIPDNAADGAHTLRVELINNNHTPLDPAVMVKISVTVKK